MKFELINNPKVFRPYTIKVESMAEHLFLKGFLLAPKDSIIESFDNYSPELHIIFGIGMNSFLSE